MKSERPGWEGRDHCQSNVRGKGPAKQEAEKEVEEGAPAKSQEGAGKEPGYRNVVWNQARNFSSL